ncbi:DUF5776 domain-containing protein, partial [uncultured Secundilactobacillus sp.]|uniref:DUF5776 domain-containing protein n=2 Tax=uncultured Secundilactobacillus sp. TaxID=2813935 RepID=UPI00258B98C5
FLLALPLLIGLPFVAGLTLGALPILLGLPLLLLALPLIVGLPFVLGLALGALPLLLGLPVLLGLLGLPILLGLLGLPLLLLALPLLLGLPLLLLGLPLLALPLLALPLLLGLPLLLLGLPLLALPLLALPLLLGLPLLLLGLPLLLPLLPLLLLGLPLLGFAFGRQKPQQPDDSITPAEPTPIVPTTPVKPERPETPVQPSNFYPFAVYGLKNMYLYSDPTFSKKNRIASYRAKPRVYRPMWVVVGTARSKAGRLRFKVKDVNHLSATNGKTGYITARKDFVVPVYYQQVHKTVTVINPRGVNAYTRKNLSGKVTNYKQGTILHVKGIVRHHLTTRYELTNGKFITTNKKYVIYGKRTFVKAVRAKTALNRYNNVNLTKRNKHYAKKLHKLFKVYRWDYSHGNSNRVHGTKRYRISGGFITANPRYVSVVR